MRGFSPIYSKLKADSHQPNSSRSRSEKRLNPAINKSFTYCNESSNHTHIMGKSNASFVKPKQKNILKANFNSFRSTPRLTQRESFRKELAAKWLDRSHFEMNNSQYKDAISHLNKALKQDPNHAEALYSRAKALICLKSYKEAIPDLLNLIQDHPKYEKNAYIALAISLVAVNDYKTARKQLTKAIELFPNFYEAYLARGQILVKQKIWDKAINDFYKLISQRPEDGSAYFGLADALIGLDDTQNALKVLKSAAKCTNFADQAYLKRGKLLYGMSQYKVAAKEFSKASKAAPLKPEAYYYKGLTEVRLKEYTEAALCLEQVVKYDKEKKFVGAAIFELGKIKIKLKDYYGAIHTFQRAIDMNAEIKSQKILVAYTEAILCLIKRKFSCASSKFTNLINTKHPLLREYLPTCFSFRAYAYAAESFHSKAVKDLSASKKLRPLDTSSAYNYLISKSVLMASKNPSKSLELLQKSSEICPTNAEPHVYQSCIYFSESQPDASKSCLTRALELSPNSEFYFFRGIVNYTLNIPAEAVKDLDLAIEKYTDNNVYHYLCRGLCYAQLNCFAEAINDFSAVIQLDENLPQGYFNRCRCALLQDDTNLAYADSQILLCMNLSDFLLYIQLGDLLMTLKLNDDAIKAYSISLVKAETFGAYLQKAKCLLIKGQLIASIAELSKALKLDSKSKFSKDLSILKSLELCLCGKYQEALRLFRTCDEGEIFTGRDISKYIAFCFFYMEKYDYARSAYESLLNDDEADMVEILYNLSVTNAMAGNYEAAITSTNELLYTLEGTDKGKLLILLGIFQIALDNHSAAKRTFTAAFKLDQETASAYLNNKPNTSLLPFHSSSALASHFSLKSLKISKAHPVLLRPSITLPYIKPPTVEFPVDSSVIQQFSMKNIKCKPEAPWLNRVQGRIQFTDRVQEVLDDSMSEAIEEIPVETEENVEFEASRSCKELLKSMQDVLIDKNMGNLS